MSGYYQLREPTAFDRPQASKYATCRSSLSLAFSSIGAIQRLVIPPIHHLQRCATGRHRTYNEKAKGTFRCDPHKALPRRRYAREPLPFRTRRAVLLVWPCVYSPSISFLVYIVNCFGRLDEQYSGSIQTKTAGSSKQTSSSKKSNGVGRDDYFLPRRTGQCSVGQQAPIAQIQTLAKFGSEQKRKMSKRLK